jgi:hypothetical protein
LSTRIIYIGLDDTDTADSRGTGNLARQIGAHLSEKHTILGITRHQLLLDDRIPYTAKNSSAAICLSLSDHTNTQNIFFVVRELMLNDLQPGSDPGLCLASEHSALRAKEYGQRAKDEIVTQEDALNLATEKNILLVGLGGNQAGVIGALAAVGLAAWGEDGRYIQVGRSRKLRGLQPVPIVMETGIHAIQTLDNQVVKRGLVKSDKLRPSRRQSRPVLYVEKDQDLWNPLKLD